MTHEPTPIELDGANRRARARACVAAIVAAALFALSADEPRERRSWSMWGGTPARNMANETERNVAIDWDVQTKKNIKWVAAVGTRCYGNPVVADGKVFVGTNNEFSRPDGGYGRNPKITGDKGVVMCFRQSDGEFLWQAVHDKLPTGKLNDWPEEGIASTCAVDGKRVYYVSNRCTLVCADTEGFRDGKNDGIQTEKYQCETDADIVWEIDMIGELGVFPLFLATSCPLVVGDFVYVHTSNGPDESGLDVPAPAAPSFIAVNKRTGKVEWADSSPGDRLVDGQWSSPSYGVVNGRGQVFFPGGDGWLYAFEPLGDPDWPGKGKLIWKFDCNPPGGKVTLGGRSTRNSILATAVFHDNRVYVGVGQNPEHGEGPGHLYAIDATGSGDVSEFLGDWHDAARVKKPLLDAEGKPKRNPNSKVVWHIGDREFGRTMSTVAIHGDLLFASELMGFLHCLDLKTGRQHWKHDLLASTWSSPFVVDGKVYIGDDDGDVEIFDASKTKRQLFPPGQTAAVNLNSNVATTAVVVDGVLYLATKTHLYSIESKK